MQDMNRDLHQISESPSSMPSETTNAHFRIPPPPQQIPFESESGFPILAISIIGILATVILLLSYYVFVTKCCLNWHHANIITHLSSPRHRSSREDLFALYSAMSHAQGLDESAIQSIPTFRYRRGQAQGSFYECAVCLNDFQEEERIRFLPNCFHVFHVDCVDTWLQTHENCPLCRSEITATSPMLANVFSEQNPNQNSDETERFVASVRGDEAQARTDDAELRFEQRNGRELPHVSSRGDECIDVRDRRGEFAVQPLRRSFSMDSSNDRQLYAAFHEILQNKTHFGGEESSSGSFGRFRRSFFSFSHSRSSMSAVLPIHNEV